jgi:hypothetical protein
LSDEQLANKTNEFRDLIKSKTSELENEKIEKCIFFCPKIENTLKMAIMSLNQF